MLPAMARPSGVGAKEPMLIDHLTPNEYLRYDADTFPSFCGDSATFSFWLETNTLHGGALLSRYSAIDSSGHSELEYALYAEGYALLVTGRKAASKHKFPAALGSPLEKMKSGSRRHLAYVFNKTSDETLTYLDGTRVGSTKHEAGAIAALDCGLTGNTAYTGLGHLAPGIWGCVRGREGGSVCVREGERAGVCVCVCSRRRACAPLAPSLSPFPTPYRPSYASSTPSPLPPPSLFSLLCVSLHFSLT